MTLLADALRSAKKSLHAPKIDDVAAALASGLSGNFSTVSVSVVDCPDLTKEPFGLVCPGLGGSPKLLEVGGPPFLMPFADKSKIYDIKDLGRFLGFNEGAFVIGAGAGPWPFVGKNCEMIANCQVSKEGNTNGTRIAKLCDKEKDYSVSVLPNDETRFALLANLFCCEGLPGKVVQVKCKGRTGKLDFVTAIRSSLAEKYKEDQPVGLGGVFLIKSGKAKMHIMPSFSESPLKSDEKLVEWLKFFEMSSPLVCVGTLVSADFGGLDLRVQHFHGYNNQNEGGHYHIDTTPDDVEYIGYFNIGEQIVRVDQPVVTHKMGRD